MNTTTDLPVLPIFQHLSTRRRKEIASACLEERYRRGAVLFRQGASAESLWIIITGWVLLVRSTSAGGRSRTAALFAITPREGLCGISALDSGRYHMSAVAGAECQALRMPADIFRDAALHEPGFAYQALRLCTRRLQKIGEQYGSMTEPVAHRVMRSILRLREQFGNTIPMTHREIAQMSLTTTESAIRVVRALKHQGHLHGRRGELTVTHPAALEAALEDGRHVSSRI